MPIHTSPHAARCHDRTRTRTRLRLAPIALALAFALAAPPALALEGGEPPRVVDTLTRLGLRTADVLVVRPIAIGYVGVGSVLWVVGSIVVYTFRTAPAAALYDDPDQTGYRDEMLDNFVRIPGAFAFQRELGDFSDGLGPG